MGGPLRCGWARPCACGGCGPYGAVPYACGGCGPYGRTSYACVISYGCAGGPYVRSDSYGCARYAAEVAVPRPGATPRMSGCGSTRSSPASYGGSAGGRSAMPAG